MQTVTSEGTLDKPADWTSEDEYGSGLAVLMHYETEDEDGNELSVSPAQVEAAVAALCQVQAVCAAKGMPKGLIQSIFVQLHQNDVAADAAFFAWKDDAKLSLSTDGKGTALIQLNKWLEWLAEDDEEEDEDGDDEDAEEDMSDVVRPVNTKVLH